MKILYAIQGTGNGHLARAREIVPLLQQMHDTDVLISGTQADIDVPFPVKYRLNGLSFLFGKKGGVDIFETYRKSSLRRFFKEVDALSLDGYDLVLNDFEPVSAWACFLKDRPCIALSHQAAVVSEKSPRPKKKDLIGMLVLKKYAPAAAEYGFHFQAYDQDIFTPVIRREVRECRVENKGHYTVYLPAYDDERIVRILKEHKDVQWEVFSKHSSGTIRKANILIRPIHNDDFIKSMAASEGVLCGAGFETPAEALFLNKKLMVTPMKAQYEQQCNAAALKQMGVPVIKNLKSRRQDAIKDWLRSDRRVTVSYPDNTAAILARVLTEQTVSSDKPV